MTKEKRTTCLVCGEPITQSDRREKIYCSVNCRQKRWQALHYVPKKDFVKVPIEAYREMQLALLKRDTPRAAPGFKVDLQPQEAPKTKKQDNLPSKEEGINNKTVNASEMGKIIDDIILLGVGVTENDGINIKRIDPLSEEVQAAFDRELILTQIKAVEAQKLPDHRNTPMGKKSWLIEQQKRINELKSQLQP